MNKLLLRQLLLLLLFGSLTGTLKAQVTRFVKQGGTGDGSSWTNASGDLQLMMDAAANGGTVYIAGGTYYPTTSTDRTKTFLLPQAGNIKLIGGYSATTGIRNIAGNPTILSGDIGATGNDNDNSYHVLVIANTTANADSVIIDGITVTKGQANAPGSPVNYNGVGIDNRHGGGICVVLGGKVAIRNTIITGNKAGFGGGGMFNHYSSPLMEDCSIDNNELIHDNSVLIYQYYGGGGMYNKYAGPTFIRGSVKLNKGFRGGGIFNYASSPLFYNSLLDGNVATDRGGAVVNYCPAAAEQSRPVFTSAVFINNRAGLGGVGYDHYKGSPTYNNCVFYGNQAVGSSGNGFGSCFFGIENDILAINNCVFAGNTSSTNHTIRLIDGSVRIKNSIIHGNTNSTDIAVEGSSWNSQIGHSIIGSVTNSGGVTIDYLAGNLIGSFNPQYANAANPVGADGVWGTADDGLQLQMMSPVINNGNNSMIAAGITTDITGAQRIQGGTVDMGAYESSFIISCGYTILHVDGTKASSGNGGSWTTAFKTLSEAMEYARYCSNVTSILVAKGTYYATGDQNGTNRDSTFLIPQRGGIKIYGGYPNGGGTRNLTANPTILSGDIGVPGNNSDNSYHVFVMTETLPGADSVVIDGFTITGANANGNAYSYNSTTTYQNEGGAVLLRKNLNAGTQIAIRNCNIVNNNASIWGGGIYMLESSGTINNCVIENNTAGEGGGGLFNYQSPSPRVINCVMSGNNSKNGAAIHNNGSSLTIINSTLSGNIASSQGGGIYNTASSNTSIVNTILWNNGMNNIHNDAALNIMYSNVEQSSGIYSGAGNINADPMFVNAGNPAGNDGSWRTADDGLKLQAGSAAINTGTPDVSGLFLNPFDLQESVRILVGRIDMGAYESPFKGCGDFANGLFVDGAVSQSGSGNSWSTAFKTLTEALNALNDCPDINTISIARGTYYPSATSNRDDAFVIPRRGNIKLYGGYPNGGGVRDWESNPTILSGDIGVPDNITDNSYHVMVITNINAGADSVIIDGVTFTKANANGSSTYLINQIAITRTTGGGLVLENTNGNAKVKFQNCRFVSNRAAKGAGIYMSAASPGIINSYIQGNVSSDNGGGISNYDNANPTLINVVISGNQASYGGAVFSDYSSPTFINATIADNFANADAGGLFNRYNTTNVKLFNTIIYGNRRPDGSATNIFNNSGGTATIAYSLIESSAGTWDPAFGTDNGNNHFVDPLFVARVNPTSVNTPNVTGNYQLQSASPVIDAGNNTSFPSTINTDIANTIRVQHTWVDLGAFESATFNCSIFTATGSQTNVATRGDATGMASVLLNRGEAPCTMSWSNGASTATINNITAGDYSCTITDANGCTVTKEFTITEPAAPLIATASFTNIKCFGDNNGSASVTITSGTAPYVYSWSNGSALANLTGLAPGIYSCTISDASGASITEVVTITQPAAQFVVTDSKTDILCYNNNTGAASVLATGGTAPYSYLWSTGATIDAISTVTAGTYDCTITDANGCSITKQIIITQPGAALLATGTQTDILCHNGNTGSATVTMSGGTVPYTYSWSNGEATPTIKNLTAGNYTCTITDANGCFTSAATTITQPAAALSVVAAETDIMCFNGNEGAASVTVSGGAAPYTYNWSNGGATSAISTLTAGTYSCTITDANSCTIVETFTIDQPAAALTAARSQTNIICYNAHTGAATLTVSGGTAPYAYDWSNGESTSTINNLTPGNYSCTVTDANGCTIVESFSFAEPDELTSQVLSVTDVFCGAGNTGKATILVNGGVAPYTYLWSNGSNTTTATDLAVGNYSCTITDANGCAVNTSVSIVSRNIIGNKIFVDSAVAVSGDGSSWSIAFKNVSDALIAATACNGVDSILIAKGTYSPVGSSGSSNRDSTFLIRKTGGLKLIGGYPSGGGLRNIDANRTILSGEIGSAGSGDNSYHVLVIAATAPGADSIVVDGFTIAQGYADASGNYYYNGETLSRLDGGGICVLNSNDMAGKIVIRNCHLADNFSMQLGGAILCDQSSPVITHCKFSGNISASYGGAILNTNSSKPIIALSEFSNNEGNSGGGAIYNFRSNAKIDQCRFLNNWGSYGGAIANEYASPLITNCFIAGNKSYSTLGGGGICNTNSSPVIINTHFIGNKVEYGPGGGLSSFYNSSVTVTNCNFYGNNDWAWSGGIYNYGGNLIITNSIMYGNNGGITNTNGGTTTASYNLLEYWTGGGIGNLNTSLNPMYVSPYNAEPYTQGNYQLASCSPAINAGTIDTTGLNLPVFEVMTGLPRIQLGRIDLGPHEANSYTNASAGTIPETLTSTAAFQLADSTTWYATDCTTLLAAIKGSGSNPVNGNTTVTVDKSEMLLPGTVSRFYEIVPENNSGSSSGTITLYYTQAEFNAYNLANSTAGKHPLPDKDDPLVNDKIANIRIRKTSGAVQTTIIPHTVNWNDGAQRWELTFDVTSFSKFYVFTENNTPLPLRLISFAAREEHCIANISWTTAEEVAVSHFDLEHSTDGTSWMSASQIKARNTSGEQKYNASININTAINFYRLKMVDIDGKTTYSKIVRLQSALDCSMKSIKLYPNPAKDIVYVERAGLGALYSIYDNAGRIVLQGVINKVVQDIVVNGLPAGMYSIVIVNRKGEMQALKLVKK